MHGEPGGVMTDPNRAAERGGLMRHADDRGISWVTMNEYLWLEETLCTCDPNEGICVCGWDEPPQDRILVWDTDERDEDT
jgi:hypothetical protein